MRFHYIYKTTNLIKNTYYIGMHSTDIVEDGYFGSGKRLKYEIEKYGIENFSKTILHFESNRKELALKEKELINEEILSDPLCLNLMYGGHGSWEIYNFNSELQKDKAKRSQIKITELRKNPEWLKKYKENLSIAQKKALNEGRKILPDFTGKIHSENTKKIIGSKSKMHQTGKGNSQFGKCWIHNLTFKKSISINKTELDEYVNSGWIKGRKMSF